MTQEIIKMKSLDQQWRGNQDQPEQASTRKTRP